MLQITHSDIANKTSADSELNALVCGFSHSNTELNDITTKDQLLQACMTKTTILVGNILIDKQACLPPTVYDHCVQLAYDMLSSTDVQIEGDVNDLVSSRWILSNLVLNLEHHISYHCRVRKYGTVLYRSDVDL